MPANTSLKFLLVILLSLSAVKSANYAIDSGEVDASAISFDSNPHISPFIPSFYYFKT